MRGTFSGGLSFLIVAVLAAVAVIIAGCSEESPTPAPTLAPLPTATPSGTPTVVPTETPEPELPQAPDFSLSTGTGEQYTLNDLIAGRDALVLVFYRSYG